MSDDLLRALGQRLREDPAETPRGSEPGDDVVLATFDPADREGILDAVMDRVSPSPASRRADRPHAIWIGVVISLAAGLALWLASSVPHDPDVERMAMLPRYEFTRLHGDVQTSRHGEDPTAVATIERLRGSDPVDWILTPDAPVHGPLAVAMIARIARIARIEPGPTQLRRLTPPEVEISEHGAVRIHARLDTLFELTPGSWTFDVWVGRPDFLPTEPVVVPAPTGSEHPWQTLSVHATIVAE